MHLTRLTCATTASTEAVDLELPDGLVGIYGANGSGKSTLIEAIPFALFGYSRARQRDLARRA